MAYQIIFRVKDYFKNVLTFNRLQILLKTGIIFAQIDLNAEGIVQRLPLLICRVPYTGAGTDGKNQSCRNLCLPQALNLVWHRTGRQIPACRFRNGILKKQESMRRGRKPAKDLSFRDKKIVERYNSTPETMPRLAIKYGISKQRVYEILARAKRLGYAIKRKELLARHHDVHQCEVCNKISQFAGKGDLITRRQLAQRLGVEDKVCQWHVSQLRRTGSVSKAFVTIRSDRLIKALQFYRDHSLSRSAVGRKFGYKNFYSILSYQKKKGIKIERRLKLPAISGFKQEKRTVLFPSMSETEFL